ncbi:uncharacterized protein Z520_08347 [Fonsecaea multimorphosa CBS 102226]|uniref:O-methyltransferase n=1 Tax=Fonsecaea multimorphosa CBS 102226 TaxID=1442371 RepID=A0A0D2JRM4_9EURO|nr:uncharacterized protein Z520_08347 [Fonsecaea multimorphosa CBS 102226]KIX96092.1 hypothetical protein Z520_08347 [Fonsecaea multimorphosa CBS 102226]OAL21858.1 hypothetical protein AYO22_07800 [Fonsecaea multimorphosa]
MSSSTTLYQRAQEIDSIATSSLLSQANTSLSQALSHALENSAANGVPPITVSPLQGQYLAIQAQLINAKNILEVGLLGGYSTLWFLSAGAHVTSLEIHPHHRDVALQNLKHAGYEEGKDFEIILAPALDSLPRLLKEQQGGKRGKFDLIFIDADWSQQYDYFQHAVQLARPNGCIYIDNVVRNILEGSDSEAFQSGRKETLPVKVGKDDRVRATLVSVVSSHKGDERETFDGFLLAVVKG